MGDRPELMRFVNLGPPLRLSVALTKRPDLEKNFVAGPLDLLGISEFTGCSRVLRLKLTTFGGRRLRGVPMHEVTGIEDVLGTFA